MAEKLDLAAPEVPPSNPSYRVVRLILDWDTAFIEVGLRGTNGETRTFQYTGAVAVALMRGLNTANLSLKSLQRRVLERLVADGFLVGAISGTPDV